MQLHTLILIRWILVNVVLVDGIYIIDWLGVLVSDEIL